MKTKITKRIFAVLLTAVMLLSAVPLNGLVGLDIFSTKAHAADIVETGSCGENVTYTLDSDGNLIISGTGEIKNYSDFDTMYYSPFYNDPYIKSVTIVDGITNVSDFLFVSCKSMTTITIPNSVINIGNSAFSGCRSLTNIIIPDSVTSIGNSAFSSCTNLTNITIPDSVTSIGNSAFSGCTGLTNITIPENVTSIGDSAFCDCTGFTVITIPENVISIGYLAFAGCSAVEEIYYNANCANKDYAENQIFSGCGENTDGVDIIFGDTVEYISGKMFIYSMYYSSIKYPQANIKSITIGENVKYIGQDVFSNLENLEELNYNATDYSGNDYTLFENCDNLTTVNIGDNVKTIPNYFLYGCDGIESITIPESVDKIGKYAFNDCSKLTDEIFEGNNKINIGAELNKGSNNALVCCYENSFLHSYADINGLRYKIINTNDDTFEIKNEVLIKYNGENEFVYFNAANKIGYNAFAGNEALKSIELSGRVNRIYDRAFENCSNLEKIIISQSITSIGDQAFMGCDKLTIWCYAGSFAEQFAVTHNIPIHYITMEISDTVVELNTFDVCRLTAELNVDLTDDELIWTSDNPDVVTVSADGKLTAVGVGKAVITATSSSGLSVKCVVTVTDESQPDPEYVLNQLR